MEQRSFGSTGITVSALGFGAGSIGSPETPEAEVSLLLNSALDLGITLIDTARSYGLSEERIGKLLHHRRSNFVLSTKVGYGVPGIPDWTGPCITAGVDQALRFLQTDYIDIVHLHSCPLHILQQGEVVDSLERAVASGKVRVAAYSGDNQELQYAVDSQGFGSVQFSLNICDQKNLAAAASAKRAGRGTLAKRALLNAAWQPAFQSADSAAMAYHERWKILATQLPEIPPDELALRFALSLEEIDSCLIGTSRISSLQKNAAIAAKGPLPKEITQQIQQLFQHHGADWPAMI